VASEGAEQRGDAATCDDAGIPSQTEIGDSGQIQ